MEKLISNNFKSFGKALKWLLDEANMSQKDLSEETEIDESTISKYISGEFNPPRVRRIKTFGNIIGGETEEQSDGSWTAEMDKKVKSAVNSVDEVEERLKTYRDTSLSLDEIVRDLQFAKQTIERCLQKIEKIQK